jgi:glycosyltransferase involved in cell wall biosynthesis
MTKDKLNIILPFYNPHAGWETNLVDSLLGLEKELKETDFSLILVNDGSSVEVENIEEIINRFRNLKYYSYPVNMGKGYAIRHGIISSNADYYIYTDIDFPFGYQIISQTYHVLKTAKTNIVIGTRDVSYLNLLPFKRRIISVLLKNLTYLITGFKIKDTQAGLKGLDNEAKKILVVTKTNSFLFELEFLKNCIKQGLSYEMINVNCRQGIRFTNFSYKIILKEIISFLKILF